MYIILGATGHIGSALTKRLVEQGQEVTGITSNKNNVAVIEKMGAKAAVADVQDSEALTKIFKKGKRLYLLNPPAPIDADTSVQEQKQVDSIIKAISNVAFEKILAESTYGAQPGNQLGDLDVLYKMEQAVTAIQPRTSVIRGAYYMSNWDGLLTTASKEGKIYSLFPADFKLPMVAPADIAKLAAELLQAPAEENQLTYIEGPRLYSPGDVANAYAQVLQKPVEVVNIKKDKWMEYLQKLGFSKKAAESMFNMTAITLDQKPKLPSSPRRGATTLDQYIHHYVNSQYKIRQFVK